MLRRLLVVAGIMGSMLSTPTESQALCECFRNFLWNRCACKDEQVAMYQCCPQTCQYVPTTCYRTETYSVPVTTYRAMTTCNPCTGCPQTCMRPVTTYVQQSRVVPFTTYRLVFANAAPAYQAAPITTNYAAPSSGCSTCAAAAPALSTTTMYAAPPVSQTIVSSPITTTPGYASPSQLMPDYGASSAAAAPAIVNSPAQTYVAPPSSVTPSPMPTEAPSTGTQQTFGNEPKVESPMQPIPDIGPTDAIPNGQKNDVNGTNGTDHNGSTNVNPTSTPNLLDPLNRTTSWPGRPAWVTASQDRTAQVDRAVAETAAWRTSGQPASSPWRASRP